MLPSFVSFILDFAQYVGKDVSTQGFKLVWGLGEPEILNLHGILESMVKLFETIIAQALPFYDLQFPKN